jgi:hypothetical protein
MAGVAIAILAVASLSDYPLRTPAIVGFAGFICIWFFDALHERRAGHCLIAYRY